MQYMPRNGLYILEDVECTMLYAAEFSLISYNLCVASNWKAKT